MPDTTKKMRGSFGREYRETVSLTIRIRQKDTKIIAAAADAEALPVTSWIMSTAVRAARQHAERTALQEAV